MASTLYKGFPQAFSKLIGRPSSPKAFYGAAFDKALAISFGPTVADRPKASSQALAIAGSSMLERSASGLGKNFLAKASAFP